MSTASHLAPWRRIGEARPLRAWSAAQLGAIAHGVEAAQQAWSAAWGLPPSPAGVACVCASGQDLARDWHVAGEVGGAGAWIAWTSGFDEELGRALWGSDGATGPISIRLTQACRADLQARLCAALRIEPAPGTAPELPSACGPWCGVVRADLDPGASLLLDAAAVEHLCDRAPEAPHRGARSAATGSIAPVATAMADLRLPLRARLADCELELASLQDLRIGDVVPLPHRLDAPLHVFDAREELVFTGYLARQGGRKAVELTRSPAATPPH